MDTKDLLAKYQSGPEKLIGQISDIPEEAIFYKPVDKSWSVSEVLVHLGDAEVHGFVQAKKIIAECGGKVCVYNQQIWADKLFYDKIDYKDALDLVRILRKNLFDVLARIRPEVWHYYIYHPESGKITLLDWIQFYVDHIEIHIEQIRRIFYAWKKVKERQYAGVS
jgi:hypothetical protein